MTELKKKLQDYESLRAADGGKGYLDEHPKLLVMDLVTALSKEEAIAVLALIRRLAK